VKKRVTVGSMLRCTLPGGCAQEENLLVGIIFERGHGCAWGNQYYVEVCREEIVMLRYFPEGASEPVTEEHIPIASGQWLGLTQLLQTMELEEKRSFWLRSFFGRNKQDGGEYRSLTLIRQREKKTQKTGYRWPQTPQAEELELLLVQLSQTAQKED